MKLCRFTRLDGNASHYGIVEGEFVRPLLDDDVFDRRSNTSGEKIPIEKTRLLPPVVPSKVVCVGRNYLDHAIELGNQVPKEPLLFLKAPSAIVATEVAIELPQQSAQVELEGELGVVIGRRASKISPEDNPLSFVLGYTCVNDVTARDLQRKDVQFTRAKSFDTFCPFGPVIETDIDPSDVAVTTRLNGEVKQNARTSSMAFSVSFLVRYISHVMTLQPGDLIATGTPAGVSRLSAGDIVEVEVEGIGILRNHVINMSVLNDRLSVS